MAFDQIPLPTSFAQKVARILVARHARPAYREDFAAEILTEVVVRWPGYAAQRGSPEAYIEVVCRSKVAKLVRDGRAQKRTTDAPTVAMDSVDATADAAPFQPWEIGHDVAAVLAMLPPELRAMCEAVMRAESLSMAARAVDEPRSTLDSKLGQLRPLFDRAGLRDYLVK
jgi:DNA-directed RNA polymerase specialized sigma24 family protein